MPKVVIAGNEYVGPIASLATVLKAEKLGQKIGVALDAGKWDEYVQYYLERTKLFCSGEDMNRLSPDVLTVAEAQQLEDFFTVLRALPIPKSQESQRISKDTDPNQTESHSPQTTT